MACGNSRWDSGGDCGGDSKGSKTSSGGSRERLRPIRRLGPAAQARDRRRAAKRQRKAKSKGLRIPIEAANGRGLRSRGKFVAPPRGLRGGDVGTPLAADKHGDRRTRRSANGNDQ